MKKMLLLAAMLFGCADLETSTVKQKYCVDGDPNCGDTGGGGWSPESAPSDTLDYAHQHGVDTVYDFECGNIPVFAGSHHVVCAIHGYVGDRYMYVYCDFYYTIYQDGGPGTLTGLSCATI